MVTSFRLSANNWRCASVPSSMMEHIHRARIVFLRKRNHLLLGSNQEVQHSTYAPDSCEMTANNKPCFYKLCPHFRNIVCHHWRNRRKTTYVFTCRIDPLLKPVFPIFGLLGIKSFWTFESLRRGVFCYKCTEPHFYLYAQSREFLFVYLLPNWGKCARVLSYLVKNSINKQHQSERVFTMARISAGAVVATLQTKAPSAARHEKRYYIITLDSCF